MTQGVVPVCDGMKKACLMGHFHEHMFVGLIRYVHKGGNICSLANEHMLPRTSVLHISLSHILSMTCIVRNSHRACPPVTSN